MRQLNPDSRQPKKRAKKRIAIRLELEWPYRRHSDVYAGAHKYALQHADWEFVLDEFADATLESGSRRRPVYDGIIARVTPELAAQAQRCRVPIVNVWFNSPVAADLPGVFPDAALIGKMSAEHLLERGFRRFACVSARNDRFHQIEVDGFHQVVRAAGFQCCCAHLDRQFTQDRKIWSEFRSTLDAWIAKWQPPLGVFDAFGDAMGRHIADSCRRHGVVVPDDAALIVSDNELALCLHPSPSLTSVDIPYEQLGYGAGEMLDALMRGKKFKPLHRLIPPSGIAARQSTDFFAVDDEMVEAAMRYISANVQRPIQVEDVCGGVFAGRRTLERRFRSVLGRTVAEEITRLRIERAKRELAGSDTPIKIIATNIGFRDAKRMHEVFVRQVRMSPSEFRDSLR